MQKRMEEPNDEELRVFYIVEGHTNGTRERTVIVSDEEDIREKWEEMYGENKSSLHLLDVEPFIITDAFTGEEYEIVRVRKVKK